MPEQVSNRRRIYAWITHHTPERGRVLDVGCGEGELLARLAKKRHARGTGIELAQEKVMAAVQRGLSVHHGDVEEGRDHYSDGYFDLVVLSFTIQALGNPRRVLREIFRVGKQVIVVFPNFGHWRARWDLAILGRAPRTRHLPYTWFDSPNRHFLTIADWEEFCKTERWRINARCYLSGGRRVRWAPNLRAEVAMYLLES